MRLRSVAAGLALVMLTHACGGGEPPLAVEEFCDLARELDIETTKLAQTTNAEEFQQQRDLVRNLSDELFQRAPEEIADVASELGPMLTAADADNERVVQLLDVFTSYRAQNCGGGVAR